MDTYVLLFVLLAAPLADGKCQPLLMCPSFCMTVTDGCYACDCGSFSSFMQQATHNMDQLEQGQRSQTGTQLSTYTSGYPGSDMGNGGLISQTDVGGMIGSSLGSSGNIQSVGLNKLPFTAPDVQQHGSQMLGYNAMSQQSPLMPGMNCPPIGNQCPSSCWSTDVLTGCIQCSCEFNIATAKVTVKPKPVTSPPVTTQRNSNTERAPAVLKPTFLVPTRPPASKNASAVASPRTTVPPATQVTLPHHQSTNEHNHQIPFAQNVYQTTKKKVAILPNRTSQKQLKLVFPTRKSDFKNALVMPIPTKETIKTNAVLEKPSTLKSSAIPETTPLAWPTDTIMFRKHDTHNADTTWLPTSTTQNVPSQSAPTTTVTSNVDPLEAANVFDNDGYASDNNEHSFIHNSGMGFYSNSNSG